MACGDDDSSSDGNQTNETGETTGVAATTVPSGTTGDAEQSSTAVSGGDDLGAFCDSVEALVDFDAEADEANRSVRILPFTVSFLGMFVELQEQAHSVEDEAGELYAAAIETAPAEVEDDLQQVADYADEMFDAIADAESSEQFPLPLPADVTAARTNIDSFVNANCGFELVSGR